MRRSAITVPVPWAAAASRYGTCPSGPTAPRTALPSAAMAGSQPGPAAGKVTGPGCARRARNAPAWLASACAPSAVKIRTTVSGCGGTHASRSLRRHPAAASTCCGAAPIQAVTSSTAVCPHSTAAVHSASTDARECRIPRASRGSGTAAKHSSKFPPDAACRLAARAASSPRASSAAAGTRMGD